MPSRRAHTVSGRWLQFGERPPTVWKEPNTTMLPARAAPRAARPVQRWHGASRATARAAIRPSARAAHWLAAPAHVHWPARYQMSMLAISGDLVGHILVGQRGEYRCGGAARAVRLQPRRVPLRGLRTGPRRARSSTTGSTCTPGHAPPRLHGGIGTDSAGTGRRSAAMAAAALPGCAGARRPGRGSQRAAVIPEDHGLALRAAAEIAPGAQDRSTDAASRSRLSGDPVRR